MLAVCSGAIFLFVGKRGSVRDGLELFIEIGKGMKAAFVAGLANIHFIFDQ